CSSYAGSNVLL
nr:immunoglobulin light chain junction region [Macaca mulatta]